MPSGTPPIPMRGPSHGRKALRAAGGPLMKLHSTTWLKSLGLDVDGLVAVLLDQRVW